MILRRPSFVGTAIGMVAAMIVISSGPLLRKPLPVPGPMIPEHGGTISSLVMHYTRGSEIVWPAYRQFLLYQPACVTVYMACPGPADFSEIRAQLGALKCRIVPVFVQHPITTWARDRWVALQPAKAGDAITLLTPKGELQQESWPARAGDSRVAGDLAHALSPTVRTVRSDLYFDGGDILADGHLAFITSAVFRRNLQHTVASREQLIDKLEQSLKRQVILMEDAPDHHAGMYMMTAGNNRMLVGDPSLGRPLLSMDSPRLAAMEGGPDFSPATQHHFDAVARLAADHGYQVQRMPTIAGMNGKQYLTFLDVIMDVSDGRPTVYMPIYQDQSKLNAAAQAIWQSLGYQVRPIDCTNLWPQGGTLHCLVNVLQRK
jgi:hypothetical protein